MGSDSSSISGPDTAERASDCISVYSTTRYLGMIYEEEEEDTKPSDVDNSRGDSHNKVAPMTEEQLQAAIGALKIVEKDTKASLPAIRALLDKEADKAGLSAKEPEEALYDEVARDEDNVLDDTAVSIYMDAVSSPSKAI